MYIEKYYELKVSIHNSHWILFFLFFGKNCTGLIVVREKFLTIFRDLFVPTVKATENDELSHELSIQKFTVHQSDKPVVSPCLF